MVAGWWASRGGVTRSWLLPLRVWGYCPGSGAARVVLRAVTTRDDSCEDWGAIPPTELSLAAPDRLPAVPFGQPRALSVPGRPAECTPALRCSQAPKTQHIVVSCAELPPHVGYVGGIVEISSHDVQRLGTACGHAVDESHRPRSGSRRPDVQRRSQGLSWVA